MPISSDSRAVVIGAGFGGLAAAARLAHAGLRVTIVEAAAAPGGKARALPGPGGPVDAGPTVLTLRRVFDELFHDLGDDLDRRIRLTPARILARHGWEDGARLDLHADPADSEAAVEAFAGPRAAAEFAAFSARCRRLFEALERPFMRAQRPTPLSVAGALAPSALRLLRDMAPGRSLASALEGAFSDPRLRQLFGRYATYVGGSPFQTPAMLMLVWHAEASGVWRAEGGMHALAAAVADLAQRAGAELRCGQPAARIETHRGRVSAVTLESGERLPAEVVVFNGDLEALARGLLGPLPGPPRRLAARRSLSADVWAFTARAEGFPLIHHNVLFGPSSAAEFEPIARGRRPEAPTLYICAQDRGDAAEPPPGPERFEIILNAPPTDPAAAPDPQEPERCLATLSRRLETWNLSLWPMPERAALTPPSGFARRFPGSDGAIYGDSPHGATAAFRRPTARTRLPGLYLAGGGTHPGPGAPMATLSGGLAAQAAISDLASTPRFRPAATPGGISTPSMRTRGAPSR
ncbi:phytoene desaturase family protein [Albimonas sp. CAU 1670]|uniref:1-hydroxycarotenoid 3,4-desaturase CrtD n=1 Tax=Albimonas sp. CAU 1670 TaxID=3032599 RepID=UPI0023D9B1F8|nr:1-hydroxycarotenoid 3,4-desaturase CrtD [Albimonas sp. CAU 1670]MDF2231486.1 phytoene desaturase family protein [Albimonas sp. CAU 1670]